MLAGEVAPSPVRCVIRSRFDARVGVCSAAPPFLVTRVCSPLYSHPSPYFLVVASSFPAGHTVISFFRGRGSGSRCQHRVSDTLGAICGEMVAKDRGCHSVLQWGDSGTEIPRRRRRHGSWSTRFMPCVGRAYVSAKDPPERGGTVWSALAVGAVRGAVDIPCHGFSTKLV